VREIVRVHQLTREPQAPAHVRGVQNLRGAVLPVLEVRTRVGMPPAEVTDRSRIVVAEAQERLVGLLVDMVMRVSAVSRSQIRPPPPEVRSQLSEYVLGTAPVEGRTSLLLDIEGLLRLPESSAVENTR
jgi:purine-binding chemotaxis protein CheW